MEGDASVNIKQAFVPYIETFFLTGTSTLTYFISWPPAKKHVQYDDSRSILQRVQYGGLDKGVLPPEFETVFLKGLITLPCASCQVPSEFLPLYICHLS